MGILVAKRVNLGGGGGGFLEIVKKDGGERGEGGERGGWGVYFISGLRIIYTRPGIYYYRSRNERLATLTVVISTR